MVKNFVLLISLLAGFSATSQTNFERGYFIDNNGDKREVLIHNNDWHLNPLGFEYRRAGNEEVLKASLDEVQEFGVGGEVYERAVVKIDKSSDVTSRLSNNLNPDFETKTVFLKKLMEGKADLFVHKGAETRYFYRKDNQPVEQLVYKRYLQDGKVAHNYLFRQQLWQELSCDELEMADVKELQYTRADLLGYFKLYNSCAGEGYEIFKTSTQSSINLIVKGGIEAGSLNVERGLNARGATLSGVGYRAGAEVQFVLPFNRNKWAMYAEPAYRTMSSETQVSESFTADLRVQYSSFELGIGAKHFLFPNDNFKLFLTAGYTLDFPVNSQIIFAESGRNMDPELNELKSSGNVDLGIGGVFADKFVLEVKYIPGRNITGSRLVQENYFLNWESKYTALSVMVGYSLF